MLYDHKIVLTFHQKKYLDKSPTPSHLCNTNEATQQFLVVAYNLFEGFCIVMPVVQHISEAPHCGAFYLPNGHNRQP
jgi:hypothetical protein